MKGHTTYKRHPRTRLACKIQFGTAVDFFQDAGCTDIVLLTTPGNAIHEEIALANEFSQKARIPISPIYIERDLHTYKGILNGDSKMRPARPPLSLEHHHLLSHTEFLDALIQLQDYDFSDNTGLWLDLDGTTTWHTWADEYLPAYKAIRLKILAHGIARLFPYVRELVFSFTASSRGPDPEYSSPKWMEPELKKALVQHRLNPVMFWDTRTDPALKQHIQGAGPGGNLWRQLFKIRGK